MSENKNNLIELLKIILNRVGYVVIGLLLAFALFTVFNIWSIERSPKYEDTITGKTTEEEIDLQYFRQIQGTSFFVAELTTGGTWSSMGASRWFSFGEGATVRNLIFLDVKSLESIKLFDTNNSAIVDMHQYPEQPRTYFLDDVKEEPIVVEWLFYEIVHKDTNADNVIDRFDEITLAISGISGTDYTELIEGVTQVNTMELWDDEVLLVIYLKDNKIYSAKIDLATQEIQENKEMVSPFSDN